MNGQLKSGTPMGISSPGVDRISISSSISNFREKLLRRTKKKSYIFGRDSLKYTLFIGCYHPGDYIKIFLHFGKKKIFWCGQDILALRKSPFKFILRFLPIIHYCENKVEEKALKNMGITAIIAPMIFIEFNSEISFVPSKNPHVYLTTHPQRAQEYGVDKIEVMASLFPNITFHIYGQSQPFHQIWMDNRPGLVGQAHNVEYVNNKNVIYHGKVSEKVFNQDIKKYQGSIRFNKFDGFGETTAKSALMGQYPLTWIAYPQITHFHNGASLAKALANLSKKKRPNLEARIYWLKSLQNSLQIILS